MMQLVSVTLLVLHHFCSTVTCSSRGLLTSSQPPTLGLPSDGHTTTTTTIFPLFQLFTNSTQKVNQPLNSLNVSVKVVAPSDSKVKVIGYVDANNDDVNEQSSDVSDDVMGRNYITVNSSLTVRVIEEVQNNSSHETRQAAAADYNDNDIYHSDNDYNTAGAVDYYTNNKNNYNDNWTNRSTAGDAVYAADAGSRAVSTEEIGEDGKTWNGVVVVNDKMDFNTRIDNNDTMNLMNLMDEDDSASSRNSISDVIGVSDTDSATAHRWLDGRNSFSSLVIYTWLAIASATIVILLILLRYRHEVRTAVHYVRTGYTQARQHHTFEESNDLLSNAQI